jgi:hypothetical protein
VPEPDVEAEDASVVVVPGLHVVDLPAFVGGRDEVLAPVLGELHDPAERARREGDQDLLGPGVVDLHAEAAADIGGDDVDLGEVQPELRGHGRADPGRRLGRGPHGEPSGVGIPAGDGAAALHRRRGAALDGQVERDRVRSSLDGGPGVAVLLHLPGSDVAGHVGMDEVARGPSRVQAHDGRQEVVGHPDPPDGVLGDVAVVGDDERDRLSEVVDLVLGQGVLGAAVGEVRMRDQQRQRLRHRPGEVVMRPDHVHTFDVEDVGDVDVDDPCMGVWRAEDRRVQHVVPGQHVVDVAALAPQEALVLDARDRLAEQLGAHARSRAISEARSTDFTMLA